MIECAVCVIWNAGKYLITQRKFGDHYGGYWEFPGGKREEGESLEACALREAKEESGLEITIERFLMTVENPYRDKAIRLHFFLCRSDSADARPLDAQDCRWVHAKELSGYLFPPANEKVIAHLLETGSDHTVR